MKLAWPNFVTRLENGRLVSRGKLRPTPAIREYAVRIEYAPREYPRVFVVDPALSPREPNGKIPHVYPGRRPCIFYPKVREWTSENANL